MVATGSSTCIIICEGELLKNETIAKRTITKNRFVSVRSHETPRTESDKHCYQNKANVWAGAAVVILKAKILVNSSVYRSRNKRNGRHQTLLLGWVQNRLKISRKMTGITERVGEIVFKSIHVCKMGLTGLHDSYCSWHLYICRFLLGLSTFLSLHSCLWRALRIVL